MSEKNSAVPTSDSPFGRFKELTRKLVSVPKTEVETKERHQRKKVRKKRRSS